MGALICFSPGWRSSGKDIHLLGLACTRFAQDFWRNPLLLDICSSSAVHGTRVNQLLCGAKMQASDGAEGKVEMKGNTWHKGEDEKWHREAMMAQLQLLWLLNK